MSEQWENNNKDLSKTGQLSGGLPGLLQRTPLRFFARLPRWMLAIKAILFFCLLVVILASTLFVTAWRDKQTLADENTYAEFNTRLHERANKLNLIIEQSIQNLRRLKGYLSILKLRKRVRKRNMALLKKVMAENLQFQPAEFATYFALSTEKAQQYFKRNAMLFMLYKDQERFDTPSYNHPENMQSKEWTDGNYLVNERERWYHDSQRSRKTQISSIFEDKNYTNEWVFSVTEGIYEKGRFQGMVGIHILLDSFFADIEEMQIGKTGGMLLANYATGLLLTKAGDPGSGEFGLLEGHERMQFRLDRLPGWKDILMDDQEELEIEGADYTTYTVSSIRLMKEVPWTLVAYQQSEELKAEHSLRYLLIGGGWLLVLLIVMALLFFFGLLQPIRHLHARMKQIDPSEPAEPHVPVSGAPEIQALAGVIDGIAVSLNSINNEKEVCAEQLKECSRRLTQQSAQNEEHEAKLANAGVEAHMFKTQIQKAKLHLQKFKEENRKIRAYAQKASTAAKQATIREKAASQAKSQFLANMNHELRTPMNAIIGYTEMLQEDAEELGYYDAIPDLQKIHGASYHLLDLINNLFDLSRIQSSKMDLYLETFDITPMIQDLAATVQPLVEKEDNILKLNLDSALGTMNADLTKVRQNLLNLLSNASKFSKQSSIMLSACRETANDMDWIVFQVSDQGIGMDEEQIQRLFKPSSLIDTLSDGQYGSAGLGLTITKQFCEIMGGELSVESEFGKGSTFTIRVPADVGAVSNL
ncbi:MAG: sensor histidine kinase [Gammaproteobacteria bacterium]|nr:sensor histidine kinase [Gammaproteobacteria bacterium]